MKLVELSDDLAVSAQVLPAQVAAIAAAGFQVLINNRPDGEEPGQPDSASIAAAAAEAGVEYHHLPVTAMDFPGADFELMTRLLKDPTRRVAAFCRSGTRCANLWVAGQSADTLQQAAAQAQKLGFDLAMAARFLENQR